MTKELKARTNKFEDDVQHTELLYTDGTKKYIFVIPGDAIFVSNFDWAELNRQIAAENFESFETYDLSDGRSYYFDSEYAEDISDALIHLIATRVLR